jgi:hypothetical protein
MSRTKAERGKREGVCAKIGSRCHVSLRVANRDFIPFLKVIFKNDPVLASQTAQWLSLGKDDIGYLVS